MRSSQKILEAPEESEKSDEDSIKEDEDEEEQKKQEQEQEKAAPVLKKQLRRDVPRHILKRKSTVKMGDMFGAGNFYKQQLELDWDVLDVKKKSSEHNNVIEEYNFYMHERKICYGKNSLFCLDESNTFRKYCVWLITWHWFDKIITLIIVFNTISLILQNYDFRVNGTGNQTTLTYIRNQLEYFFTAVFLLEFLLKIIGMGFILEASTYLRDGWNVLDFAVVVSSVLSLIGSINLSAIRTIRILRPLRSIKSIPGLRILVSALLDSLPYLGNVVVFLLYLLTIFGILGLQLFAGANESRCRLTPNPINGVWTANASILYLCADNTDCPDGNYCGNPIDYNLPDQNDPIPDLDYKFSTFNNILAATFTIFQSLTTEGWSTFTYQLAQVVTPAIVYIYFVTLTLLGSFFTVNLILAVINDSFLRNQQERKKEIFKEEEIKRFKRKEKKQKEKLNAKIHPIDNLNAPVASESSDSDEEAQKKKQELIKSVLKPTQYVGRAEFLKQLQDQHNKNKKEKDQVNYFDPSLYTLDLLNRENTTCTAIIQQYIIQFIDSTFFMVLVNLAILGNTIVLALDRYPQPDDENSILNYVNLVFTLFFVIEMILKLYAMGIINYFRDSMNTFDCVIVIISLVEQVLDMSNMSVSNGSFTAVSAFRTLRIFRIFKLARSWTSFREILIAIASTLESISLFTILLLLFMIIASLIGMELFAYNVFGLRLNFDTFFESMITIFTLLSSESWNITTYQYMEQMGSWWPLIFFVTVVLFGNFILLKLFIAILIYNFGQSSIEAEKKLEDKTKRTTFQQMINQLKTSQNRLNTTEQAEQDQKIKKEEEKQKKKKQNLNYVGQHTNSDLACFFLSKYDEARFEARKERKQKKLVQQFFESAQVLNPDDISDDSSENEELQQNIENKFNQKINSFHSHNFGQSSSQLIQSSATNKSIFETKDSDQAMDQIEQQMVVGNSLFVFHYSSKFRRLIFRFINKSQVVAFIILMILISSILLALEDPLSGSKDPILQQLDLAITVIFMCEAVCKIIALGFIINGQYSYMRDIANILDFTVIIFSVISVFTDANLQIFKILRVFRVLRPLRLISRNDSLKIAINALLLGMPKLINLFLVCLVFYLLFGIFGVNFFKGAFYHCDIKADYIITINDCFDYGGNWLNTDYNFDNVLNAMIGLFVISTTEGWIDQMNQGIDSVGIGYQPKQNNAFVWSLFYVGFVIIGSFFVMNLFAGVILDAFNSEKEKLRGYFYLTLEQQEWVDIRERIYLAKPLYHLRASKNKIRLFIFKIVSHERFEQVVFSLIVCNTIIFMVQYTRQPDILTSFISYSNLFFLFVFALELILKLIALGTSYFNETFNIFDCVVVILTAIGAILEQMNLFTSVGTAISVLRSFRIIRIMRLIRSARSLRIIFETFIITIPELANIGGLLTIILFMYAVLGMNLYPYVKRNQGITFQANFTTLLSSFFLLFKCSTGEQWDVVMADLSRASQPNNVCYGELTYDDYAAHGFNGCGDYTGTLYLISFQLIFSVIMLNLFVAVIVQGYDKIQKDDQSLISSIDIQKFQEIWKFLDPNAIGLIRALDLHRFLIKLPKPLGWRGLLLTEITKRRIINEYRLPVYIQDKCTYYYFYDVMEILSHQTLQRKYGDDTELEPKKQVKATKDLVKKKISLINGLKNTTTTNLTSEDINSAFVIMRRMKHFVDERNRRAREHEFKIARLAEIRSESQSEDSDNSDDLERNSANKSPSSNLQTQTQLSAHPINTNTHSRITSQIK